MTDFFITQSIFHPFAFVAVYLIFVTKIGPNLMKNREPMKLNNVMIAYNLLQIFINVVLIILGLPNLKTVILLCSITSQDSFSVVTTHHAYALLKVFDFLETIIFVLRKKDNQVSLLHVFHHVGVFSLTWIGLKYSPGGPNYLSAVINCVVHTLMYFYYLLSTSIDKKQLWWKKYMTVLQVVANWFIFLINVVSLLNPSCSYPKWILLSDTTYMLVLLYLFSNFYNKNYLEGNAKLS
ncbi:very long chain fatty acid elongase 4-like [Zophobas morio]|uniref:very long chain fatty acid elongase 4-like n=1 Tax=Zophobas morio TaxID=2755281 RepID=UPI003083AEED